MPTRRFESEGEAYSGLGEIFDIAAGVDEWFRRSGKPVPDPVSRLLGPRRVEARRDAGKELPMPSSPPRPPGAGSDWMWMPKKELGPMCLILTVLGAADSPLSM